jgi:DNA segregation ATPase FtsK/SpoIIIE, S-DNA-T family
MAKRRGRPPKKKELTIKSEETRTIAGLVTGFVGLLAVLTPFVSGTIFGVLSKAFGIATLPAGLTLLLISAGLFGQNLKINNPRPLAGFFLITMIVAVIGHFVIPLDEGLVSAQAGAGGGYVGFYITEALIKTFGRLASAIVILISLIIAISLISGMSLSQMRQAFSNFLNKRKSLQPEPMTDEEQEGEQFIGLSSSEPQIDDDDQGPDDYLEDDADGKPAVQTTINAGEKDTHTSSTDNGDFEPEGLKYPNWVAPSLDILSTTPPTKADSKIYTQKATLIEKTLRSFGINAKVSDIKIGPRVVQYALSITVGTKVSKVKSLGNDLALALAAPSGSVRIEAPIPGTSHIGIEVPNEKPVFVTLGDMLTTQEMKGFSGTIPLVLGKNIAGKPIIHDLARMPHLLVAGATGSGKSICINSFLCGVLMKHSPDYVKFILVDPKMVELTPYNGIPHLLTPVITDVEKVINSLEWLVTEMQKRFRILNKSGSKNIEQYNTSLGYPALPYIILVVDEMADLMLAAGIDVESKIVRLAQMARAVGIHLVLATQRPSVDVLTGLIKANIPARIGMNVATSVDSRVILDMIGAESLLGDGDMLFKAPDSSRPMRLQGSFLSNKEIEAITGHIKSQVEEVDYNTNVIKPKEVPAAAGTAGGISEDTQFADAVRIVAGSQKASASLLQRKLRIGYNRAARLIDEMHAAKIVGPPNGSKPRQVLISDADSFLKRASASEPDEE